MSFPISAGEVSIAVLALLLAKEALALVKGKKSNGNIPTQDFKYWRNRIDASQTKDGCKDIRDDCGKLRDQQHDDLMEKVSKLETKIDDLPKKLNGYGSTRGK